MWYQTRRLPSSLVEISQEKSEGSADTESKSWIAAPTPFKFKLKTKPDSGSSPLELGDRATVVTGQDRHRHKTRSDACHHQN